MGNDMTVLQLKVQAKQEQEEARKSENPEKFAKVMEDIKSHQKGDTLLDVNRSSLFVGAMAYLKEQGSEILRLKVQFLTDSTEESVVNIGGPNKEFFTLLFNEFLKPEHDMFEGKGSFLLPTNNRHAIDRDYFFYFGKAVVLSLCSDGIAFPHFPPFIINYIRGLEFLHELNIVYVVNTYLVQYILKVNAAEKEDELTDVITEDPERFMDNCGWPKSIMVTMKNKMMYVQTLLQWDLIDKRREALNQMKNGLSCLSFLEKTKHFSEFVKLFEHRDKRAATAEYIKEKLKPKVEELKARNEAESNTKTFTAQCLADLTDEEASSLFQFISGLDDIPVSDFSMNVDFNRSEPQEVLPKATTCLQILHIPLGNKSKVELYSSFNKALTLGRIGFDE